MLILRLNFLQFRSIKPVLIFLLDSLHFDLKCSDLLFSASAFMFFFHQHGSEWLGLLSMCRHKLCNQLLVTLVHSVKVNLLLICIPVTLAVKGLHYSFLDVRIESLDLLVCSAQIALLVLQFKPFFTDLIFFRLQLNLKIQSGFLCF